VTIQTRVGSLETYDDGKHYDAVVATDVLEHIEDDRGAARRLVDLAKPSGHILITVPAERWLFGYHDTVLGHYRRYDKRALRRLFHPWIRIEQLRYYGFGLIPVALLFSRLLKRPYPTARVGMASRTSTLKGKIVRGFFELEKHVRPPMGTSLLMMGRAVTENGRRD
jgi:SAM-dependent methyltransferase